MLLRTPDFYAKFHCTAGKCTDTCCIGWEIDIDEQTQARYAAVTGTFGETLHANIEDGHFVLGPGDRCPFLDYRGLCEIYRQLGEKSLCAICTQHPRFVEVYGDIEERGLGLCCEEAARLLLEENASPILNLVESETDDPEDDLPEEVREARDAIFQERENMFRILAESGVPLNTRLAALLDYAQDAAGAEPADITGISPKALTDAWTAILKKGESFGTAWDKALDRIIHGEQENIPAIFSDEDGARIVAYMLFRYYAKSLFDGDSLGKVQLAIFFWLTLKRFGKELSADSTHANSRIAAIKLLSKQIEYSEENLNILADNFVTNRMFSTEAFKKALGL